MADENIVQIIINGVDRSAAAFAKPIKGLDDLQKAANRASIALTATFTALGASFAAIANHQIRLADSMEEMAQRVGTPVEALSRMVKWAGYAGVSTEELEQSLKFLSKQMIASSDGASTAGRLFAQMGISAFDASGKLRSTADFVSDLAGKFASYRDNAAKSALATELFSRAGLALIPALNQGKESFDALQQAQGGVSEDFGRQAHEYVVNVRKMQDGFHEFGNEIAKAVLPYLTQLSASLVRVSQDHDALRAKTEGVRYVIQLFASAALATVSAANLLGQIVGYVLVGAFGLVVDAGRIVIAIFNDIVSGMKRTIGAVVDVVKAFGQLGAVVQKIVERDFKGAWQSAQQATQAVIGATAQVAVEALNTFEDVGKDVAAGSKNSWANLTAVAKQAFLDAQTDAEKYQALMDSIWATPAQQPTPVREANKPSAPTMIDDATIKKQEDLIARVQEMMDAMSAHELEGAAAITAKLALENEKRLEQIRQLHMDEQGMTEQAAQLALASYEQYQENLTRALRDAEFQRADLERALNIETLDGYAKAEAQIQDGYTKRIEQIRKMGLEESQTLALQMRAYAAYTKAKHDLDLQTVKSVSDMFGNLAAAAKAFGNKGLAAYKVFASAQALMNTYSSAVAAYNAMAGIPFVGPALAVAAAAAAVAAGLANVAQINSIKGQAHSGLDYVPATGTYILERGEAVIKRSQNEQLAGLSARMSEVNIYLDSQVLARGLGQMSRDGRLNLDARAII